MKDKKFKITLTALIILLVVVIFYMFFVHVPYYTHRNYILNIRNKVCEENELEYDDYFFEFNGQKKYYIMKVKVNNGSTYIAIDEDAQICATYSSQCYDEDAVKKKMMKKFNLDAEDVKDLDIAYENAIFCYYKKIQKGDKLLYIYYNLQTGELVKSYDLSSNNG